MGIYDRDYMSDKERSGIAAWPMFVWLMVVNIVVFIAQSVISSNSGEFQHYAGWLSLSKEALIKGQIWRLLTFQFSHSVIPQFIFNMIGLFFIGRMIESLLGRKNTLWLYLIGGLVGGLAHVVCQLVFPLNPILTASTSILAMLMAVVATMPEQQMGLLFLPFRFKVKYVGYVIIGLNVLGLLFSLGSASLTTAAGGTSYVGNLGGILAGWLFVKHLLPILRRRESLTENRKQVRQQRSKLKQAEAARRKSEKKKRETAYLNNEVDAILEKISENGMQSLTPEEKKVLDRHAERLSKKLDGK